MNTKSTRSLAQKWLTKSNRLAAKKRREDKALDTVKIAIPNESMQFMKIMFKIEKNQLKTNLRS